MEQNYYTWVFINDEILYCEIEKILGGHFIKDVVDKNKPEYQQNLFYVSNYLNDSDPSRLCYRVLENQQKLLYKFKKEEIELQDKINTVHDTIDRIQNQLNEFENLEIPLKV